VINITRLKHQEGSFARIHIWAIEREVFGRSHKWNIRLNIVKDAWFIAKLLSLKKNHGEIGCHKNSPYGV